MKNVLLTLILAAAFLTGYSQMNVEGNVVVESGANLVVEGVLTVGNGGDIENDGTTTVKDDVVINTGGTYNSGSTGTLVFAGTVDQDVSGTATPTFYGTVEVNNGNNVTLSTDVTVQNLTFTSGNVKPGTNDLTVTGTISGASATDHVITDNTGTLAQTVAAVDVLYPVGNSAYNPVTLNNSGTSDVFSVRVKDALPTNFSVTDHSVARTWEVSEAVAGGSTLTVTPQWNGAEEQTPFDRTDASVGVTADNGTTFTWAASGAAGGANPYTLAGAGFTGVGEFVVADYYYEGLDVDVDIFLAGPYNSGTGTMNKDLNTNAYIPLTDPYLGAETVTSIPTDAVDWILVEFRDKTDNTSTLYQFARFLDVNGQIIDPDGSSPASFTGVPKDDYYIAILHRNHFGVVSASTVNLGGGSPAMDFTSALSSAWDDALITSNDAMQQVASTPDVYALWAGDANNDGIIALAGASSDRTVILNLLGVTTPGSIVSGYNDEDVSMDGDAKLAGAGNDRTTILNSLGVNSPGNVFYHHLP